MAESRDAMRVWTLMDELVVEIHSITRKPPDEGFGDLAAALRGASVRAALKIVQGLHGPASELPAAFRSALGLLAEMRYHLYLARRMGLIDLRRYKATCSRHERTQRCLRDLLGTGRLSFASNGGPDSAVAAAGDPLAEGFAHLDGTAPATGSG